MAVIEISSWTELDSIRADVSETASYVLTRSLLKTDADYVGIGDSWVPISGMSDDPLARCQLDMNGFTIEGLTTTTTSNCTGLFGRVGLEFCCANGIFDGAVIAGAGSGQGVVAGRVPHSSPGWAFRNIRVKNSFVNDGIVSNLNGGIVGAVGNTVRDGVDDNITDGVIEDCSVENCRIGGSASGSGNYNGGISGWLRGGTIRRCASVGNKIDTGGASTSLSGGICVSYGSSLIEDCYVDGILFSGYRASYSGGIAARHSTGTCTIRRCWVGDVDYNTTISGGSRRAIASVREGTTNVSDCFYDVDGYAWNTAGGGTAKTTAEMYQQATFTNWDFDNVWYIQEGEDYPRLIEIDPEPPYRVRSWTELNSIRADVSATASYVLTRSLLKTDADYVGIGDSWVPISGMSDDPLARCQLDMNGFTIDGLTTTTTSVYTGLFGRVGLEFCCENGIFDGAVIAGTGTGSGQGVVAGCVLHSSPGWAFRNIRVKNSFVNDGRDTVGNGGIVGIAGDVRGGTGGVNGNTTDGGIEDCSVENCRIGGSSTYSGNYNGGITGWLRGGTIRRCTVRETRINPGGGSATCSGGICVALGSSLIEDCYVDGILFFGNRSSYSGGIAMRFGSGTSTIRRCWVGDVRFNATLEGGGQRAIVKVRNGTTNVSDCYYDVEGYYSWGNGGGGTAKTTAEMYQQATFTDWDFDDVWYIQEGEDYPRLRGVDTPPAKESIEVDSWTALLTIGSSMNADCTQTKDLLISDDDYEGIGDQWIPLGYSDGVVTPFSGSYNGQGFKINGLSVATTTSRLSGLFASVENETSDEEKGYIHNLVFDDCVVGGESSSGSGVLAGAVTVREGDTVGVRIEKITVLSSTVSSTGGGACGALIGTATVEASSVASFGIEQCAASECVVGGNNNVSSLPNGGLVGVTVGGTINQCKSKGNTIKCGSSDSEDDNMVGGLVGLSGSNIIDSYVEDVVFDTPDNGVVAAGVALCQGPGSVSGSVTQCWVSGITSSLNEESLYGVALSLYEIPDIATSCFFNADNASSGAGEEYKTHDEMLLEETFYGWQAPPWMFDFGVDYPRLIEIDPEPPYRVRSWADLRDIQPNSLSKDIYQMANLTKEDPDYEGIGDSWTPIGVRDGVNEFSGVYHGQGFKIEGLMCQSRYFETQKELAGLFGAAKGAVIDNLVFDDCFVEGAKYNNGVGVCVGRAQECSLSNIIVKKSTATNNRVGVITSSYQGAIAGVATDCTLTRCSANDVVIGSKGAPCRGGLRMGGLIGLSINTELSRCCVEGAVIEIPSRIESGDPMNFAGGLAGLSGGALSLDNFSDCYSENIEFSVLTGDEYSLAGITCNDDTVMRVKLSTCWSAKVTVLAPADVVCERRGIVYSVGGDASTTNCYYDLDTTGNVGAGAGEIGRATPQMKKPATFNGWDLADVWYVADSKDYPRLRPFSTLIVPDLRGMTRDQAVKAITDAGFAVGEIIIRTVDPRGQMMSWVDRLSVIRSPVVEDQFSRIYLAKKGVD